MVCGGSHADVILEALCSAICNTTDDQVLIGMTQQSGVLIGMTQ